LISHQPYHDGKGHQRDQQKVKHGFGVIHKGRNITHVIVHEILLHKILKPFHAVVRSSTGGWITQFEPSWQQQIPRFIGIEHVVEEEESSKIVVVAGIQFNATGSTQVHSCCLGLALSFVFYFNNNYCEQLWRRRGPLNDSWLVF